MNQELSPFALREAVLLGNKASHCESDLHGSLKETTQYFIDKYESTVKEHEVYEEAKTLKKWANRLEEAKIIKVTKGV